MSRKRLVLFLVLALIGAGIFSLAKAQSVRPAFPTNFTASSPSACAVDIAWDQAAPGAYYYNYYQSTDNFVFTEQATRMPGTGYLPNAPVNGPQNQRISKLKANTDHWYQIEACNTSLCSFRADAGTKKIRTKTLPNAPQAPVITQVITTQSGTAQEVELIWTQTGSISNYGGFAIYMSQDGSPFNYVEFSPLWGKDSNGDPSYDRGAQALRYKKMNLSLISAYSFQVKAYDTDMRCSDETKLGGPTNTANQVVFSPASANISIPKKPVNLAGVSTGGPSPTIKLTWTDRSDDETKFEIVRSTDPSYPQSGLTVSYPVAANLTDFTDTQVQTNTTYYYHIRACVGTISCSTFSPDAVVATGLINPELNGRILYADAQSSNAVGKIFLSWKGIPGASFYVLQRGTTVTNFATVVAKNPSEPAVYYDGPPLGDMYYYRLKAVRGTQEVYSNIVQVNLKISLIFKGQAWAAHGATPAKKSGAGWIRFSSGNDPSATKYSVQIDSDKIVSGLAWVDQDRMGWLSFNEGDLQGCPSGSCKAEMDQNGNISGWARFFARKVDATTASGWTGWVKLNGTAQDGAPYGVKYDATTKKLKGSAWGANLIGWIAMNDDKCPINKKCNVVADSFSLKPTVSNVVVEEGPTSVEWCDPNPFYTISWNYNPPESTQANAEIKFVKVSDGATSHSGSVTIDKSYRLDNPLASLVKGTRYKVQVRATDGSIWSEWTESPEFLTPTHAYPIIDFDYAPSPAKVGRTITFTDKTTDRSGGAYPVTNYEWAFTNASRDQSTEQNPQIIFSKLPADATLTVKDSSGAQCSLTKQLDETPCTTPPCDTGGGPAKRKIIRER